MKLCRIWDARSFALIYVLLCTSANLANGKPFGSSEPIWRTIRTKRSQQQNHSPTTFAFPIIDNRNNYVRHGRQLENLLQVGDNGVTVTLPAIGPIDPVVVNVDTNTGSLLPSISIGTVDTSQSQSATSAAASASSQIVTQPIIIEIPTTPNNENPPEQAHEKPNESYGNLMQKLKTLGGNYEKPKEYQNNAQRPQNNEYGNAYFQEHYRGPYNNYNYGYGYESYRPSYHNYDYGRYMGYYERPHYVQRPYHNKDSYYSYPSYPRHFYSNQYRHDEGGYRKYFGGYRPTHYSHRRDNSYSRPKYHQIHQNQRKHYRGHY